MLDTLDSNILHALQLSPRVSFRRIADVVDAPEQAVARRYRKLQRGGVVRVIGLLNPQVYGDSQWVVRVRAKPDDLPRLAEALVRRPEVTHANVLSGWTELVCIVRAPLGETKDSILQRLPRTSAVLGLEVDLICGCSASRPARRGPPTVTASTRGRRPRYSRTSIHQACRRLPRFPTSRMDRCSMRSPRTGALHTPGWQNTPGGRRRG